MLASAGSRRAGCARRYQKYTRAPLDQASWAVSEQKSDPGFAQSIMPFADAKRSNTLKCSGSTTLGERWWHSNEAVGGIESDGRAVSVLGPDDGDGSWTVDTALPQLQAKEALGG